MSSKNQLIQNFENILATLKKVEESTAIFSELGKVAAELEGLQQYITSGLNSLDHQYNAFQSSVQQLSCLVDFQKKIIPCRSSEKTLETITHYLKENIVFDHGFFIYKLKQEEAYETVALQAEQVEKYKNFLNGSNLQAFSELFEQNDLSHLIAEVKDFHPASIQWELLNARSAVVFPLKTRGQQFGLFFLIRTDKPFEREELSRINLVIGLLSLILFQNFYFARLKTRLFQQSKMMKVLDNIKYADFFENGPLLFFTLDTRFTILHANSTALKEIEVEGETIIGEEFFEIIPVIYRAPFRRFLLENQDKPLQIFRCPVTHFNGKLAVLEFVSSRLKVAVDSHLILILAGEVTENYYRELIDHRNEVLDEIDQFSRILVSQFNNLLTTILPNIELLKKAIPPAHSHHPQLETIENATRRSANLIQKFLNYDVANGENVENANINKILNSYLSQKKKEVPSQIKIVTELDSTLKNTRIYPSRIRRLLDILFSNAVIAVQEKENPSLKFSTAHIRHQRDGLVAGKPFYLKRGEYLELVVRDNGTGIPDKSIHQVLKPFYSTRVKNEGVGLELFFAYNLVKDMKGHIFIDSRVAQYTAVYVYLPFMEEKEMASRSVPLEKTERKAPSRQATILVVDDEYNIRSMMKEIMEMSGLKVYTAGNGRDGVNIYERHKSDIDLIIMDMVMPIMDGRAAFAEIRKINPKQKIFIISGYSQREDLEDMLDNGAVGFLRKPFQVKEIVERVNQILRLNN